MRTVLSLLLLTSLAWAEELPPPREPTRQEVEESVARCDSPTLRLRADQCDVLRNRLKVIKGERDPALPHNDTGRAPKRPIDPGQVKGPR